MGNVMRQTGRTARLMRAAAVSIVIAASSVSGSSASVAERRAPEEWREMLVYSACGGGGQRSSSLPTEPTACLRHLMEHASSGPVVTQGTQPTPAQRQLPVVPCVPIPAFDDRCETWEQRLDESFMDVTLSVAASPDGSRVFVTGATVAGGGRLDIVTAAYDAETGEPQWSSKFDGPRALHDIGGSITVSPDSSVVYVAGISDAPNSIGLLGDYAVIAYDAADGKQIWWNNYDAPAQSDVDIPWGIVAALDGSAVYVTGWSYYNEVDLDAATVAFDANSGEHLWVQRYHGGGRVADGANAIAVSRDGDRVFVTGWTYSGGPARILTIAYDSKTGEMEDPRSWVAIAEQGQEAEFQMAIGWDVVAGEDGSRVYVTGVWLKPGEDRWHVAVIAYAQESGKELWRRELDYYAYDVGLPSRIAVGGGAGDAERVFIAGGGRAPESDSTCTETSNFDFFVTALDGPTGDGLWSARYDGAMSNRHGLSPCIRFENELPTALGVSPDGERVYVTGWSASKWPRFCQQGSFGYSCFPAPGYATAAYDAETGQQVWAARLAASAGELDEALPQSLAVGPDGDVFVTGRAWYFYKDPEVTDWLSEGTDYSDGLTVAYEG